ncbi:MAG: hypothetical protein QM757_25595 [Paludibaculum sp.]
MTLRFPPTKEESTALLTCGPVRQEVSVPAGAVQAVLLESGPAGGGGEDRGSLQLAGRRIGAHYIELRAGK